MLHHVSKQTSEKSSTKLKVKINLNLSATKQDGPTTNNLDTKNGS